MIEFLNNIPTPFNMIVAIVLICSAAGVLIESAKQVRRAVCHQQEIRLKRDLLESGMTAEEIERVVRATSTRDEAQRRI